MDLSRGLQPEMLDELSRLSLLLDVVSLNEEVPDKIRWRFDPSGEYTASSAYLLQFEGAETSDIAPLIWNGWAPGKCRFFLWTVAMNIILTADALQRRGWLNDYFCALCIRNLETPLHLLTECTWAKQIWSQLAHMFQLPSLNPTTWNDPASIRDWLQLSIGRTSTHHRKGAYSMVMLGSWELSVADLVRTIRDEATLWKLAGASFPFDPG
jgi:hypothetical protein